MPVITAEPADPVAVSGLDAAVNSVIQAEAAGAVQVYGLPATVLGPTPTPSPTPDAVKARVLDDAGNFICHLPHTLGLQWLDEFNTAGAGSIDARRYEEVEQEHPGVWTAGNQVVISIGSLDVFRIVLDAEPGYRLDAETGERVDTWAGLGALGVLNSGMVFPEYGFRAEAFEERSFDYGSNPAIGGWLVSSEWKTPVGKPVRQSWRWTYRRRRLPRGWPEKRAQWLWWKNPDSTSVPNETCYFRSSFTLSAARRIKIWVCGDDNLEFQVDGEVRATTGPGGWRKASTVVLHLSAGTHYVAARVTNAGSEVGNNNRSGFLCAIGRLNSDGDVVQWIRRSNPATWTVRRQGSAAPGWFAAQVLRQLVLEQQVRGCAGHAPITFGFTTARDSAGVSWSGRHDLGITVGTLGLDYVQRLVEAGLDVAMTPALKLHAWRSRGVDRSSVVKLDQGNARALDEAGSQPPSIRNYLYARAKTGWVGRSSSSSIVTHGERETMVSLGSSRSQTQTATLLGRVIDDLAAPPQTIEVRLSGAAGRYQPYRHYNVGDWVGYRMAGSTTWTRYRVMSISGEVTEAGHPDWTLQLYED